MILQSKVATCDICQRRNGKMAISPDELHPVPVKSTWHHVAMDFIGPLTNKLVYIRMHTHIYIYIYTYTYMCIYLFIYSICIYM